MKAQSNFPNENFNIKAESTFWMENDTNIEDNFMKKLTQCKSQGLKLLSGQAHLFFIFSHSFLSPPSIRYAFCLLFIIFKKNKIRNLYD